MYERPDGTSQASLKFPVEWLSVLRERADRNRRSVNSECIYIIDRSLEADDSAVGSPRHPWEAPSDKLSVRFTDDEMVETIESAVEGEEHSFDQEVKHRIMKQLEEDEA